MLKSNPIHIYVDHWEDYESIGDKAMLLNAMRRLEKTLGPCAFITPYTSNKPGAFLLPNTIPVTPPQTELLSTVRQLRVLSSKITNHLPFISKDGTKKTRRYFDWAERIISFKMLLYSIGLKFVFGKDFRDFLERIKQCDVFFTVGDCSLNDYWLDGVVLKSWLIKTVRSKIPVCVLSSQGIGPLTQAWARRRLVKALKKLDILSFRDYSYSKALVEAEGLSGLPYKIVGDEAFSFPSCDLQTAWSVLQSSGVQRGEPFIAVNFRNTDFTQSTTHLLNKTAELLDQVISTTHKSILFVCMSKGKDYGRDHEAGLSLKSIMKHSDQFHVLEHLDDISLVKGIITQAAYTMGISYHLHVFSLSQGHPTVALYTGDYYKTKLDGLIAFYGEPSRSINLAETGIDQIVEYVTNLENQYSDACAHVTEVNQQIAEENDWTITMVREKLIKIGRLPINE